MKYIVLIYCCCLLTGTALAQQLIGVKGGYGLHRMEFMRSPAPNQQWVKGMGGGVAFRSLNSKHLGLQLELLLEQKGWHLLPGTPDAYHLEEQHLVLPIQSVVLIGKGRLQLIVSGGAFAAYILQEEVRVNAPGTAYQRQRKQDWQYGLLAGLGPAVRIGAKNWVQLEGRFSYTLSNRLEPNLATGDAFNVSQQQSATVSLVWLTQISAAKNNK